MSNIVGQLVGLNVKLCPLTVNFIYRGPDQ